VEAFDGVEEGMSGVEGGSSGKDGVLAFVSWLIGWSRWSRGALLTRLPLFSFLRVVRIWHWYRGD